MSNALAAMPVYANVKWTDCAKVGDRECINCGECIDTCPVNAISLGSKVKKADTNVAEATNN